jgi:hypothetical protein
MVMKHPGARDVNAKEKVSIALARPARSPVAVAFSLFYVYASLLSSDREFERHKFFSSYHLMCHKYQVYIIYHPL